MMALWYNRGIEKTVSRRANVQTPSIRSYASMSSSISPDTVIIQLTKGLVTIISVEDSDLSDQKWWADFKRGKYPVAVREIWPDGKRKQLLLHRVILERIVGRSLGRFDFCDHKDGNTLNNVRSNLRLATPRQNAQNQTARVNTKSPYKGVDWHSRDQLWRARITVDGKTIHLGLFKTQDEAYAAYCIAAEKHHGEFAYYE